MWFRKSNKWPSAEEVARRLVVLKYVVGYAITVPPRDVLEQLLEGWGESERIAFKRKVEAMREDYWGQLRALGLWGALSAWEREFAKTTALTMTHQQQVDATWRIEAMQALMWALGLIERLPPYWVQASYDLLKEIPGEEVGEFIESARLRSRGEIERARDLAELWHWRSRTRQLIEEGRVLEPDSRMKLLGVRTFDDIVRVTARHCEERGLLEVVEEDFSVGGRAYRDLSSEEWSVVRSITIERHFALNWLCGYAPGNRWDETPTET